MTQSFDGRCSCGSVRYRLSTRQPWVVLPEGIPAVDEYYQRSKYWPQASLDRLQKLQAGSEK